jgi:glucosyl-dolichyl phosphate glucuronosyltransferase
MLVTVLFSTRNRAARLAKTLEGLTATNLPPGVSWEIVVADNGSTDKTEQVLSQYSERLPLRRVWEPQPGLSRGRNAALAAARGELLLFTDDDVTVTPHWLAAYTSAYQAKGQTHYFGGPIESEFESQPAVDGWLRIAPASVVGLDWGPEPRELTNREYFIGPNWACAAAPVRRAGGFDPRMGLGSDDGPLGGEEVDLMERLGEAGLRSWYVPTAQLRHWVPADKTGEAHLKARWRALAAVRAWKGMSSYGTRRSNGIPWRFYPDLARAALRRVMAAGGIGNAFKAEANYLWHLGLWEGFRLPARNKDSGLRTED